MSKEEQELRDQVQQLLNAVAPVTTWDIPGGSGAAEVAELKSQYERTVTVLGNREST